MFTLDLTPMRGDDFSKTIRLLSKATSEPVDLSEWTWASQIRKDADSTEVMATITVDTTRAAEGILTFSLPASVTAVLSAGVWDLQGLTPSKKTWCKGSVRVGKDVTR